MRHPVHFLYNTTTTDGFENITNGIAGIANAPTSSGHSSEKHPLAYFLEVYYSLALLVFGTIGNLLSLAVLSRKAFRSSPIGICLRFLALADLTALYTGPLYFTAIALHDYNFRKVSVASCRIHRWVSYVSVDLSAWTLVVMSTARLTSVLWPLRNIFTHRKTYITLFVTFIIIVGINSPTFFLYGTVHLTTRTLRCVATNPSYRYFTDHIWSWLVLVKFGLLPGSILLVMNVILVIRVYRSRRHIDEMDDGDKRDPASSSAFGRARLSFGRWLKNSQLSKYAWRSKTNPFANSSTIERPNTYIVENVDPKDEGEKIAEDSNEGKGRAGFRTSTETIMSTVTENERLNTAYDKPQSIDLLSASGDKGTLCQNGEQFLQVPTKRPRTKGMFTFANFPKYQLQKLQKKCGSFTFPKRDRRKAILKTTEVSKEDDSKSEFHDRKENGILLYVTENDETVTTNHAVRGKTSQSYSDGMVRNASCILSTENKSQSLSAITRADCKSLKLADTEDEDKVRSMSESHKEPTRGGVKIKGNNSFCQTILTDPHGSDSSSSTQTQEAQNYTLESESATIHKDNMSDIKRMSWFENCDRTEMPSVVTKESYITTLQIRPGNRTLSDSNIHRTISNNSHSNTENDGVSNKTDKDLFSGANLTKSTSSSAVYDRDSETTNEVNLPQRTQMSQRSNLVNREGKHLSFTTASRCAELSVSTHTLPADTISLADFLNKHKEINISSNSMNSISDTSIHELKLAVRGKLSARGKTGRSHKQGVDKRSQKHRNLTLTVIVFNAVFILCNVPIIIYMAGRTYIFSGEKGTNSPQYVMEICSNYSMYTNNAINFVLYCITGSRFRQELKRMLCQLFNLFTGSCFCRRKN